MLSSLSLDLLEARQWSNQISLVTQRATEKNLNPRDLKTVVAAMSIVKEAVTQAAIGVATGATIGEAPGATPMHTPERVKQGFRASWSPSELSSI
jgi:hypothetical protein